MSIINLKTWVGLILMDIRGQILPIIIILILLWISFYIIFFRKRGKNKVKIIPFIGFGTRDSFSLSGRVILDRGDFISYSIKEFKGKKFIRNYRRIWSIRVPNAKLEINFGFRKEIVKTDEKGYYKLKMILSDKNELPVGTNRYSVKMLDDKYDDVETFGDLIIIPKNVSYGVICDIDDTILHSRVQQKIRLVLRTFMSNERDMKPIPGMNQFLYDLHLGINKTSQNPILYLTASPFDLHDKIASFIKTNHFPIGPILMKKLRGDDKDKLFDTYNYKIKRLREVLDKFPYMKFIFIGDNTEKDIEVFNQINDEYPNRIILILIMNITGEQRMPERYRKALLCENSFDAYLVCLRNGILSPAGAFEIGKVLKDLNILSPELNINDKIDECLPFPYKKFKKFMKKREKYLRKRKNILGKLFGDEREEL